MTKKLKLTIIISGISVLLLGLLIAYFIMDAKGVWQEDILAYEYTVYRDSILDSNSGFTYNGQEYISFSEQWSIDTNKMADMGGYLWRCHYPWKHYACRMYADNVENPTIIYSQTGDDYEFALKDFEFSSIWDATYDTVNIKRKSGSLKDSDSIKFVDSNGNHAQLMLVDIIDISSGFVYNERPEKFTAIGFLYLYWCEYPCLFLDGNKRIYFDGNDYYISLYGTPDPLVQERRFYKITNEQLIDCFKRLLDVE